jgi:hypothetical protein
MNNNSDDDKFSIKGHIQKRKTQEVQRVILDQQIAKARGDSASTPIPPRPQTATLKPALTQKKLPPDKGATLLAPSVRVSSEGQRIALIVSVATLLIVFICAGTLAMASNTEPTPAQTATFVPVPNITAMNIVDYLGQVGLSAANIREYNPQTDAWRAVEELEFNLQQGSDKAEVIALTYPSSDAKMPDVFKARRSDKFKTWQLLTVSNMILLISPESSPSLSQDLTSHVMHYAVGPYRSMWPTATSAPAGS